MFKHLKVNSQKLSAMAISYESHSEPAAGIESQIYLTRLLKSPAQLEQESARKHAFSTLLKQLRLSNRLSVEELSSKAKINRSYLQQLESDPDYRASPRTLLLLADFYKIPKNVIMQLSGAIINMDDRISSGMIRFAAMSENFSSLSPEEKKAFHEFITVLRDYNEHHGARNQSRHRKPS